MRTSSSQLLRTFLRHYKLTVAVVVVVIVTHGRLQLGDCESNAKSLQKCVSKSPLNTNHGKWDISLYKDNGELFQ
ncbi:hypothetical protein TcWFU_006636 [Taenia crassiceps]|uniref:Uncharacterized protein n=1 Tax=Taenia crassiceps TaxID=6207 RepID=A0ABR4Q3D9_9CEST